MNLRGETSKEVSDTSVPNVKQLKIIASMSSGTGPQSRRRSRASVFSSSFGASTGTSGLGSLSRSSSWSVLENSESPSKKLSISARVSGLASPAGTAARDR